MALRREEWGGREGGSGREGGKEGSGRESWREAEGRRREIECGLLAVGFEPDKKNNVVLRPCFYLQI